jgi:hypothetical protein
MDNRYQKNCRYQINLMNLTFLGNIFLAMISVDIGVEFTG